MGRVTIESPSGQALIVWETSAAFDRHTYLESRASKLRGIGTPGPVRDEYLAMHAEMDKLFDEMSETERGLANLL